MQLSGLPPQLIVRASVLPREEGCDLALADDERMRSSPELQHASGLARTKKRKEVVNAEKGEEVEKRAHNPHRGFY